MDSWGGLVTAILGGGALGSVFTQATNYLLARAKQPVDQYDGLVTKLQAIINTDRKYFDEMLALERSHCDVRITKLEKEINESRQREYEHTVRDRSTSEQIGELKGRLDEQRRMLEVVVKRSEDTMANEKAVADKAAAGR